MNVGRSDWAFLRIGNGTSPTARPGQTQTKPAEWRVVSFNSQVQTSSLPASHQAPHCVQLAVSCQVSTQNSDLDLRKSAVAQADAPLPHADLPKSSAQPSRPSPQPRNRNRPHPVHHFPPPLSPSPAPPPLPPPPRPRPSPSRNPRLRPSSPSRTLPRPTSSGIHSSGAAYTSSGAIQTRATRQVAHAPTTGQAERIKC